ncbi:GNAT family N-acetyltransferase [Viridibacillus sp. NPDC093762]|uniref:GNAT family N-acetyltransferase n=1 Tax=Viridibacillus sp. NPDC093762 TaxID=3390720 RepID=UPI003D07977B
MGNKTIILETERLYARELVQNDFQDLADILQDERVMYAYEHTFNDQDTQNWLNRQLSRYKGNGFGLWAILLRGTDIVIGQAGLTMQQVGTREVLEIGYLLKYDFWHNGYATEIADACRKYAFSILKAPEVYSIIKDDNIASQKVAMRIGMHIEEEFIKQYYNGDMVHYLFKVENKL